MRFELMKQLFIVWLLSKKLLLTNSAILDVLFFNPISFNRLCDLVQRNDLKILRYVMRRTLIQFYPMGHKCRIHIFQFRANLKNQRFMCLSKVCIEEINLFIMIYSTCNPLSSTSIVRISSFRCCCVSRPDSAKFSK